MENNDIFKSLWVERYRPSTLEDMVLSEDNRKFFDEVKRTQEIPNLMFMGAPGIGKSTIAKIIVNNILNCQYLYINASEESGIDAIRNKVINFAQTKSIDGKLKVIICDEADGLSFSEGSGRSSAQQALRNVMEEYASNVRFILTCNYPYKVIPALHSRCQEFDLTPPFEATVKRIVDILKKENVTVDDQDRTKLIELIKNKYPDIRKTINSIQKQVINGKLSIKDTDSNLEFAQIIFDKLVKKMDMISLRNHIIQNEIQFDNDYHQLLKGLFEVTFSSNLDFNKKRQVMLCISSAMYQHQISMDQEVNAYSCLLSLSEII